MRASYFVLKRGNDKYAVLFMINGKPADVRGSNHSGIKEYDTEEKANKAGERYLERMRRQGFDAW